MNSYRKFMIPQILISLILMAGVVLSTSIAANTYFKVKRNSGIITVTGSAKKEMKSDFVVWKGQYSVKSKTLSEAYTLIRQQQEVVKNYLVNKKVPEKEMTVSSIETNANYVLTPNGYSTSEIDSYRLTQSIELRSNSVDMVSALARESTELIQQGIEFQSMPPQYFYTKIAELKKDMLALATDDARQRAIKIAEKSGTKLADVKSSKMGVFQIAPLYSNQISDYGINDTSSVEKEIMAVMNCEFTTK